MEKISLTEHEQASIAGSCGAVPLASGARVAARGPELLRCLFAHWRHILRPDRAARVILAGRSWQAAGAVLLALVEINAVLLIEIGAPLADAWPVVVPGGARFRLGGVGATAGCARARARPASSSGRWSWCPD